MDQNADASFDQSLSPPEIVDQSNPTISGSNRAPEKQINHSHYNTADASSAAQDSIDQSSPTHFADFDSFNFYEAPKDLDPEISETLHILPTTPKSSHSTHVPSASKTSQLSYPEDYPTEIVSVKDSEDLDVYISGMKLDHTEAQGEIYDFYQKVDTFSEVRPPKASHKTHVPNTSQTTEVYIHDYTTETDNAQDSEDIAPDHTEASWENMNSSQKFETTSVVQPTEVLHVTRVPSASKTSQLSYPEDYPTEIVSVKDSEDLDVYISGMKLDHTEAQGEIYDFYQKVDTFSEVRPPKASHKTHVPNTSQTTEVYIHDYTTETDNAQDSEDIAPDHTEASWENMDLYRLEDPNSEDSPLSSQLNSIPEDMSDMVISGSTQSLEKLTVIIGFALMFF